MNSHTQYLLLVKAHSFDMLLSSACKWRIATPFPLEDLWMVDVSDINTRCARKRVYATFLGHFCASVLVRKHIQHACLKSSTCMYLERKLVRNGQTRRTAIPNPAGQTPVCCAIARNIFATVAMISSLVQLHELLKLTLFFLYSKVMSMVKF